VQCLEVLRFGIFALQHPKGNGVKYAPGHGPVVPQTCPETGSNFIMGGPFWAGPIHDQAWIQALLAQIEVRIPLGCHL
jgi:tRNA (guanine26-N2/guanine27-N2)-dimethyltransferase